MPGHRSKLVGALLGTALLIVVSLLAYKLIQFSRPSPGPQLPKPNGYDDFVKAGQLLVGNPGGQTSSQEELRELLARNAAALKLVRQGLTRTCRVPTDFSLANFNVHMSDLAALKSLTHLMVAEGRLAELERRTNEAVQSYLEAVRFGEEACRGGLVIDKLVGIAIQATGVNALQKIAPGLDANQCRSLIQDLENALAKGESQEEIMKHERKWSRENRRFLDVIRGMIVMRSLNPMKQTEKQLAGKLQHIELLVKRLMIALAGRAYELEHGKPPNKLTDMVPAYLHAMPIDPVSGTNMNYLPLPPRRP